MKRRMLPLFVACVFAMAGALNAQCNDAIPACPEQRAVDYQIAYEIVLAEVPSGGILGQRIDAEGISDLSISIVCQRIDIRNNSGDSINTRFAVLKNIETHFFMQALTGNDKNSILARPRILTAFDTISGIVIDTEEEWYKIALVAKRVENSSDVISNRVTLVRTVLQDGEEVAYPATITVRSPWGATMLLPRKLGDKEFVLLITPRQVVDVQAVAAVLE